MQKHASHKWHGVFEMYHSVVRDHTVANDDQSAVFNPSISGRRTTLSKTHLFVLEIPGRSEPNAALSKR
jgi:hypothetical protein